MERHLLGRPHQAGKMGFLVSGPNGGAPAAFEETLSAKDRRMRQVSATPATSLQVLCVRSSLQVLCVRSSLLTPIPRVRFFLSCLALLHG